MTMNVKETEENKKNNSLTKLLGKEKKEELAKILAFGEKYKAKGERKKKEFRTSTSRGYNELLLNYEDNEAKFLESLNNDKQTSDVVEGLVSEEKEEIKEVLMSFKGITREKFIKEFLHDYIFYSGKTIGGKFERKSEFIVNFDWRNVMDKGVNLKIYKVEIGDNIAKKVAKSEIKEGVIFDFRENGRGTKRMGVKGSEVITRMNLNKGVTLHLERTGIGNEGAKIIAKGLKLKEGVHLGLAENEIGPSGAKEIAENMNLEIGVTLKLSENNIGDEGARQIAEKLKLKIGVILDLAKNNIGDAGAEAIINNMKLEGGVILDLRNNPISEMMKKKLKEWENSYKNKGINCRIII